AALWRVRLWTGQSRKLVAAPYSGFGLLWLPPFLRLAGFLPAFTSNMHPSPSSCQGSRKYVAAQCPANCCTTVVPQEEATTLPDLSEEEREDARERTSVTAYIVHEAIRLDGEEELRRSSSALAWSGFAAGLSMGFSLVAEGVLRTYLPDAPWRPVIAKFGYSLGFLIVILGRQQLFTENTLTAILPLLARRNLGTCWQVLRLWMIVLVANLAGAHLFAWVAAVSEAFQPQVRHSFLELGNEAIGVSFGNAILRGIFAGWLIALVVWLNAAYDT